MICEQVRVGRRMKHSIPVTAPVKRYLEKHYPNEYDVTRGDFLGTWCINALVRKTVQVTMITHDAADQKYLRDRKITDRWSFLIPVRYQDNLVMPKRRVIEFHHMMMQFINTEIIMEMEARRLNNELNYIQVSIDSFRDRYNIRDNDLNDERIRKIYLRFREKSITPGADLTVLMPAMLFGKINKNGGRPI
ncbi:hypothetical protein SAMN05216327_101211 [Dyadobacter sp. SG02]|nr:hypothetical protein SAMN05216327_101211 [Dyadobacter sp. SG02]